MTAQLNLESTDFKTLLELGDSARHTLLWMLEQFNYGYEGELDRSHLTPAESQKIKRGMAELKEAGFVLKDPDRKRYFKLNPDKIRIQSKQVSIEQQLVKSGLYDTKSKLFKVLVAIEEFFYDFEHTPALFKVKGKMVSMLPCDYFQAMVANSEVYDYGLLYGKFSLGWTALTELRVLADLIKQGIALEQGLVGYDLDEQDIEDIFKAMFDLEEPLSYTLYTVYPYYINDLRKLKPFLRAWMLEHFSEFFL